MKIKFTALIVILCFVFSGCKKKNKAHSELKVTPVNFLSDTKYKKLVIDLVYDKGAPPSLETINSIKNFLNAHINKPAGIDIILKEINGTGKTQVSLADITQIESTSRVNATNGDILTAFVYLVNAGYSENSNGYKTLGIQYATNSIALFGKTMRDNSGGITKPQYNILETTVALHEFGHILGLVDAGTEMISAHMDAPHGHHCSNNRCLMYYATETTDIIKNLVGGSIPPMDNNCLNDLKNNGGK